MPPIPTEKDLEKQGLIVECSFSHKWGCKCAERKIKTMEKNKEAQSLGKRSWEKRTKGMSKEQISEMMKKLQKPKRKKVINTP